MVASEDAENEIYEFITFSSGLSDVSENPSVFHQGSRFDLLGNALFCPCSILNSDQVESF